jgi:hypothetical protein
MIEIFKKNGLHLQCSVYGIRLFIDNSHGKVWFNSQNATKLKFDLDHSFADAVSDMHKGRDGLTVMVFNIRETPIPHLRPTSYRP